MFVHDPACVKVDSPAIEFVLLPHNNIPSFSRIGLLRTGPSICPAVVEPVTMSHRGRLIHSSCPTSCQGPGRISRTATEGHQY